MLQINDFRIRRINLFFSFFIIFISASVFGQYNKSDQSQDTSTSERVKLVIRNSADLTLEFNMMYNYGVYELSGNYNGDFNPQEFINGENFGVRHGLGGILTAKIPVNKNGYLRANFSLSYCNFSSRFNKTLVGLTEPDFMKYNVFSGIVGIENNFTPNFKIKTYAGIGLIGSIISGNGRITDEGVSTNLDVIPAFRLGVSVNSGLEYMYNNQFGFNCGIRFTHANLWLKQTKASGNPNETYLNDKKTSEVIKYAGFKQFAWGSFYIGVNYFFGIHQKEYYYSK